LRDCDVLDGGIEIRFGPITRREHAGDNFFSGERGEGKGTNELLGGAGHHDLDADPSILQQADDFCRFVGCDAAGDTQSNFHTILIVNS
jgi:hypothetical protein